MREYFDDSQNLPTVSAATKPLETLSDKHLAYIIHEDKNVRNMFL